MIGGGWRTRKQLIGYAAASWLLWNGTPKFLHWTTIYRIYLRTTFVWGPKIDTRHPSESTQYTRDTLRRRCSRGKTIFTTDSWSIVPLNHGWCHRTWALIARIHYRWSRRQRLDWTMHCGESWSQRHPIRKLGAGPHTTMTPPVNENRWKVWPHGELNGNWRVWAAIIHPVASRSCTCSLNYESAFLNGRKQQASWTALQWDHRETLSQLRGCWNSEVDNWAPNSMNHTLIFYFLTRSWTNATASKQVIASRVRSSLDFFQLRLLRRHSKYYHVFASFRNSFCHVWTASGCWRDHRFALSSWFTTMLAPTRSHGSRNRGKSANRKGHLMNRCNFLNKSF